MYFSFSSANALDFTNCSPCSSSAFICVFPLSSIGFIYFSNVLPRGEYVNVACSITLLWFGDSMSLPVRYLYLSIFSDDDVDVLTASMLISNCSFSSLILSSIVMISFYIFSKRFFLTGEGLSNAKVASITKKEYGFAVHFCKDS